METVGQTLELPFATGATKRLTDFNAIRFARMRSADKTTSAQRGSAIRDGLIVEYPITRQRC